MKKYIFGLAVLLWTSTTYGVSAPTLRMGLQSPTTGDLNYPQIITNDFNILDASSAIQDHTNTFTGSNTFTGTGSTVTVNQDLALGYLPANICIGLDSNKNIVQVPCGGGSATLAFFNGTASTPGVAVTSPTSGANFDSLYLTGSLRGGSTFFLTVRTDVVTVQGNTFNGVNQLTQTNGSGLLPSSVFGPGLVISTNVLQGGTTFYVSSGTANNFQASTATVYTLLQVNGTGLAGSNVVGQIAGSAFNVAANGRVGLGTALPAYALDEQAGLANFAQGINTSSVTASTVTLSGRIVFPDGTVQVSAPVNGAANLAISSGNATVSTVISSPTINVVFDSTTFNTSLRVPTSSFVTINFKGGGLTNTILATDANGTVISTTVAGTGSGINNQSTLQSGATAYPDFLYVGTSATVTGPFKVQSGTFTVQQATISVNGVVYTFPSSGTVSNFLEYTSGGALQWGAPTTGSGPTLAANQTWTGQNNWTTASVSSFTYGVDVGTLTFLSTSNLPSVSGSLLGYDTVGVIGVVGTNNSPSVTGITVGAGDASFTAATNQLKFTGNGGGNQTRTISISPTTVVGELTTLPDTGHTANQFVVTTGSQSFVAGNITFAPTTAGPVGTTTNDDAQAGNYGEYISSLTSTGGDGIGASAAFRDAVSITLTAGDWDITGFGDLSLGGSSITGSQLGISVTSGNSASGLVQGQNDFQASAPPTATYDAGMVIPALRKSINSTTTYYLKLQVVYTGGAPLFTGRIDARRVR